MRIIYIFLLSFLFIGCSHTASYVIQNDNNEEIFPKFDNKYNINEEIISVENLKVYDEQDIEINNENIEVEQLSVIENDNINDDELETEEENDVEDDFLDEFETEDEQNDVVETDKTCLFSSDYDPSLPIDVLGSYNRVITTFNDNLFSHILIPTANAYQYVVPEQLRDGIGNFFDNLKFPVRLINNLAQGKFDNAFEETQSFLINTTVGIFGIFDPAKNVFEIEEHKEDFGQTLGYYGIGGGYHIVLPLFGPSNVRDIFGLIGDSILSPIDYNERNWYTLTDDFSGYLTLTFMEKINTISYNTELYDKIKMDAIDLYPYFKEVYEQRRDKEIKE